jgi:linoleate 8R-lipoxygenase/9,12-octadecadienoate 8-hydroperoxide 8R-isomerase
LGIGPHQCLGYDLCITGLTTMLKTIAKLGGLRRAPGSQGQLKKIVKDAGITAYMTADEKSYFPFPTTMKVQWDGEI